MKFKSLLILLTFIFGFFLQQSIIVHAEDTPYLKVKVTTDKQEYTEKDEIVYKLIVSNTSNSNAKDVVVTSTIPDSMKVTSKDSKVQGNKITWNVKNIGASSEVQLEFKAKVKGSNTETPPIDTNVDGGSPSDGTNGTGTGTDNGTGSGTDNGTGNGTGSGTDNGTGTGTDNGTGKGTGNQNTVAPKTGDTTNLTSYLLIFIISAIILFIAVRALVKKRVTKGLGALLILALLIPTFASVQAEEKKETAEYINKLVIKDKEYVVTTTVEAVMEVNKPTPSKNEIPVTGVVSNSEDKHLVNEKLTFSSKEGDSRIVETDNEGYFVVRLQQGETYNVTGKAISATITATGVNDIQVQNTSGKITLGKTLTNGDNKSVLQPSAIFLGKEAKQIKEVAADMSKVIFRGEVELNPGDVFLIPELEGYPTSVAFKATNVTKQDNQTIVVTSNPKLDETFSAIKGNTAVELSPEYFIPAPGITVEKNEEQSSAPNMLRAASLGLSTKVNLVDLFPKDSLVGFNGSVEVKGKVTGDIDWAFEPDLVDSWDFKFEGSQEIKGKFASKISEKDEIEERLGEYRIPTSVPGLAVSVPIDVVVNFEGEVAVEVVKGMSQEIGIEYTDRNGVRVYPEDKVKPISDVSDITGSGQVSMGLKLSVLAEASLIDIVGISGEGGVSSEVKTSISGLFQCSQVESNFYVDFGIEAPIIDWSYPVIENKLNIGSREFGSCVRSIEANPKELKIAPGESKNLLVKASNGLNNSADIAGDKDISYTSSDSNIIKIEKDANTNKANVIAAEHAQDGDVATITITYKAQGREFTDEVSVQVVDGRERGTLVGKVVDAVNADPLKGAAVKIYTGDHLVKDIQTKEDGTYDASLVPGTYKMVVSYPDYITETSNVTIHAANTTTYDSKLQMVGNEHGGIGIASGKITNAVTGQTVPGLKLDIRKGRNNVSGEIVKSITTDEQGGYTANLPGGNYTLEISGPGYITTSTNIIALGGITKGEQNATISPDGLLGEGIRVVLNWGENPRDLDSHFTGPTDNGSRFHVYYNNKNHTDSKNVANLDVDDTSSFGPETVTVLNRVNEGTYTYAVHNYTDRFNSNLNLSNSNATVRLYSGDVLLATYNVPIDKTGNVWRVFEIRNGAIVPINSIDHIDGWDDASYFAPKGQ